MSDAVSKLTLGRARSAILARDFTLAENLFKSLLEKEPENIELLGEMGSLYQKTGRDEEALSIYQQILDIDGRNLEAINSLGSIYRKLRRYRESVSILEQGIIIDEHNIQLFYNLGFTYKEMHKYPGAIHCFEMVVAHNKDDVLAYNHLGSIYSLQGDYSKAVETLSRGLKIDPNHPVLHLNLAKAYEKVGNVEAATLEYEAALRSKPGWFEAIDGYADLLLSKDNTVHAQDLVGQALSLHPDNAGMHTKMGHVYSQLDAYSEAQAQYNEALSLDPESREALSGLADAYESDGKVLEALHTMETYEKLSPEDVDMLRQYTHILLTGNKLNAAYEKIQKVYEHNPEDVKTLNLMGQYYICSGEDERAGECFQQIRSIDPSYVAYYKDGAMRYGQKGDHAKAEEGLKKYLDVRPYDSRALSMLASNYEKQERYDDAQKIYVGLSEKHSGNPSYKQKLEDVSRKILTAAAQPAPPEPALGEGGGDLPLPSVGAEGVVQEGEVPAGLSRGGLEEPAVAEAGEGGREMSLGYNLEGLTQNDENASPFERQLDDEIQASRSDDNSLDALISEDDKMDRLDDEGDFFADNPFGAAPAPKQPQPADDGDMFQTEELDDGIDSSAPLGLDEDISSEDGGEEADGVPDFLPESEADNKEEEMAEAEPDDVEVLAEEEEVAEAESDDVEVLAEDEGAAEAEPDDVEVLAEDEEMAEAELGDVEAFPEAEELSEPEELELEPEDMADELEELPGAAVDLPQGEEAIEEPDVVEELAESSPVCEDVSDDFFDDGENELAMELSEIEDAITDRRTAEKYKPVADMLRQLRGLADSLPADKKADFMQGENRLRLEWAISRLEGRPGLMAVAEAWRKDFDLERPFSEPEAAKGCHGVRLLGFVLDYMKNIIGALDDVYLAATLGRKVEDLVSRLGAEKR